MGIVINCKIFFKLKEAQFQRENQSGESGFQKINPG